MHIKLSHWFLMGLNIVSHRNGSYVTGDFTQDTSDNNDVTGNDCRVSSHGMVVLHWTSSVRE